MAQASAQRHGIPNGQFAGRIIEFSDPELDRKFPHGIYLTMRQDGLGDCHSTQGP